MARSNGIELVELHVLEAEDARRQHAAGGDRRALQDVLEDGLPVDGVEESGADAHVVERRRARVHAREDHAPAHHLVHGELGVALEGGELGRRGDQHHVGVAGLERDHARPFLGHHLEDHAVEERLVAPVGRVPLEDHVGIGLPLDEAERPGADGRPAEVLPHLLHRGGRDDARAVHGERAEDRAVGLPGRHVDREVVHHLGAGERAGQARPARRRGAAQRAVEA